MQYTRVSSFLALILSLSDQAPRIKDELGQSVGGIDEQDSLSSVQNQ